MATRKTASSSAKKPAAKRASSSRAKATTTRVVTKKPTSRSTAAARTTAAAVAAPTSPASKQRFSFSRSPLLAASIAEFVGTFMLAGVVLATKGTDVYILFALTAIVLAVGGVSGAHVNPALTIGAWATRRVTSLRAICYLVAQVLGGLLALVVMNAYVSSAPEVSSQAAMLGQQAAQLFTVSEIPTNKEWLILAAELLGTTIFAFAVAAATREKNRMAAAFTVGGGLFVALVVAGYAARAVEGSVILNPAVAASVQAVSWGLWPIMIYVVAPLVGGVIGFALQDLLRQEGTDSV